MATVVVDAVVEGAQGTLEPHPREQGAQPREQRPRRPGEEDDEQQDRSEHERPLEPEVGVHVVVADREQEADGAEQHGGGAAEPSLEQDDRGQVAGAAGVPLRGLEDPDGVSAQRGRQDLPCRVRDVVRAGEPGEAVVHPLRLEQPLPPQRHRDRRHDHDRDREQEPPGVGCLEDVPRARDVDLPAGRTRVRPS